MTLIGSIFDDGEAYIQSLLSQLAKPAIWKTVVKTNGQEAVEVPCPLVYSDHELSKQKTSWIGGKRILSGRRA